MNVTRLKLIVVLILLTGFSPLLHAAILATNISVIGGGATQPGSQFRVRLGSYSFSGPQNPIFDGILLSAANVGQTFTITQSQDSDFNALVAYLKDGAPGTMQYELSTGTTFGGVLYGLAKPEDEWFAPLPLGNNGIDFQGFNIDSIALRLDSVATGVNWSIRTTTFINGSPVPEPSTATLMLLGAAAFFGWRRKRA